MSDKNLNFELIALTEEEIKSKNIDMGDLWLIKFGQQILGPYMTKDIANYARENEDLFENAQVFHIETEQWKQFYSVPYFQRRKPKLVPVQSLKKDATFYILKNGQKIGPYKIEAIRDFVIKNELLISDQISDDGQNWIKIYQHFEFDRRHIVGTGEKLPFSPDENDLQASNVETEEMLQKIQSLKTSESTLLASFASLKNQKESKDNKTTNEEDLTSNITNSSLDNSAKTKMYYAILGVLSVIVLTTIIVMNIKNNNYTESIKPKEKNIKLMEKNNSQKREPSSIKNNRSKVKVLPTKNINVNKTKIKENTRHHMTSPSKVKNRGRIAPSQFSKKRAERKKARSIARERNKKRKSKEPPVRTQDPVEDEYSRDADKDRDFNEDDFEEDDGYDDDYDDEPQYDDDDY
ncbi:hypothetical protein N9N67_05280 [Bacteriovoracaceae bacterium]|nr:hypothetical protein [Bacteriovoracaceae bacterium]